MYHRVMVVILCVCVCVCLLPCLAAMHLVCMSKVRHHRVSCRLLKICVVWASLKMFSLGDMALLFFVLSLVNRSSV